MLAVLVDYKGFAAGMEEKGFDTERSQYGVAGIAQQGKGQPVFCCKGVVVVYGAGVDTDYFTPRSPNSVKASRKAQASFVHTALSSLG